MAANHLQAGNISWGIKDKLIVSDISFSVNKGETLGIVGPNGAGKTSLLKCLYRENTVSQGTVYLSSTQITQLDRKHIAQKIAVVSQQHEAVFSLTVLDIVNMGLIPHKRFFDINTDNDRKIIEHALTQVDLLSKKHQVFNTLSGGEQQRCLIARAIVQRPEILIMDEPTNHLDVYYQHQILSIVKKLGLTVIMTIHDLNLAAHYCDRLLLLADGKSLAWDTPANVLNVALLKQVFKLDCIVDTNPLTQKPRVSYSGVDTKQNNKILS